MSYRRSLRDSASSYWRFSWPVVRPFSGGHGFARNGCISDRRADRAEATGAIEGDLVLYSGRSSRSSNRSSTHSAPPIPG